MQPSNNQRGAQWKTSSYSAYGAQCVEAAVGEVVGVRDSKSPHIGQLVLAELNVSRKQPVQGMRQGNFKVCDLRVKSVCGS